jgi:hypothetical protein
LADARTALNQLSQYLRHIELALTLQNERSKAAA